jgi:O-antigen ligase
MATGTVVLIEPAPIDIGLMLLLASGLVLNQLEFRDAHALPMLLLGLVAAANLLSTLGASDTARAVWYCSVTLYLLCSWVFFVGLVSKHGLRSVSILLNACVFAGLVSAIVSSLAYFHLIPFQDLLLYGRPKGLFKDPNVYGPYLVPVAVYAIANLNGPRSRFAIKLFWACAGVIATAGILLSFSRACWMSYGVSLIGYFALDLIGSPSKKDAVVKLRNLAITVVLVGATLLAAVNIPEVSHMISIRWGSSGLQDYDQDRFETQRRAVDLALERPLGVGPGQAEIHFELSTHSTYVRVLVENGIAGFLALALFLLLSLARSVRLALATRNPRWRMLFGVTAACIAGYLVNSAVIDTVHWRHIWLFLALAWASHRGVHQPAVQYSGLAIAPQLTR